jgi:hypothetical protein
MSKKIIFDSLIPFFDNRHMLNFITNASVFDPTFIVSPSTGVLRWNLGDTSTNVNANSFTHIYRNYRRNKLVKIYEGTTGGVNDIIGINMENDGINGTLNFLQLSNLGGDFNVNDNPQLTRILNPNSSQIFTSYLANNCNLRGILNIDDLTGLGGNFQVLNNINLTNIYNPISSQIFSFYGAYNCNLTGTLNLRGLTNLGGIFTVYNNPNLTYIFNPASPQVFTYYEAYDCNLSETLDISGFTNLGGILRVYNNPNLKRILNPVSSQEFTDYRAYDCNLTGTLDVSGLTGLGGEFVVNTNPDLTQILNPVSSQVFENYIAYQCDLTGTLDLTGLTNLGGYFIVHTNPKLTTILNPDSSQAFGSYVASNCDLTGTLDLTGLTGLGRELDVRNNPNLTTILNPDSSNIFIYYWAHDCSLNDTLDVSGLINLGGDFRVQNNTNLTHISLPTINQQFVVFNANNCALNLQTVDGVFSNLDSWYSGVGHEPSENLTVNVAGGNNSPVTDCCLNINIVNLTSIFNGAGKTFTYYINCSTAEPSTGEKILQFTTNASTDAFDPIFTVSSGILNWNLGDASNNVNSNNFSHTYISGGNKTVQVFTGTTDGSADITAINMDQDNLIGTLDISSLNNLNNFNVGYNTNLTQILNPVSSQVFTFYNATYCDLTGILDVSGLTGLGGSFYIHYNPSLTQILNPISSQVFGLYDAENCNLTGTIDVSGLTGLGGFFDVNENPSLTSILNPDSSQVFTYYRAYKCDLTGTLDVSGLTGLGGVFAVYNNPNLTHITLPTINQQFTSFDASGCGLDLATVNDIFANLDAWYSGVGHEPSADLTVNVASGTNSPPTDCSLNANIVNLTSIFNSAGQTFTYYINCNLFPEYYGCASCGPYFATPSPTGGFLSADVLTSSSCEIGDYVIEWNLNSSQGSTVFVSGVGTDPSIQSQHPFIDEIVFAGTLYPIIKYVYLDSIKYSAYQTPDARYSPDFTTCLDPVIIEPITCDTSRGVNPLYLYDVSYNNIADSGANKSRTFKFDICPSMDYLAWEFDGYDVTEQIKIYYCTSTNVDGSILDNFVHGTYGTNNTYLTQNLYPTDYPNNPRIYYRTAQDGIYGIRYITKLDNIPYSSGDYLKIQIIASVYDPTNNNTRWDLRLKALSSSDISCNWIYDSDISKIIDDPSISYVVSSTNCHYKIEYDTLENAPQPIKNSITSPFIWKYLHLGTTAISTPAVTSLTNPVRIGLYWYTQSAAEVVYTGGHNSTSCVNCNPGQSITYTLQTSDVSAVVITCTDTSDYDAFVSGITYVKNSSRYSQWLTVPDTSIQYYSYYETYIKNASSCGDSAMGYDYFFTHFSADVSWNPDTKTITMPIVLLNNNIVDVSCNPNYSRAQTLVGQIGFQTMPNPAGRLPFGVGVLPFTTQTRVPDPIGGLWLYNSDSYATNVTAYYTYRIHDVMLNDICDLTPYGFMYDMSIGGTASTFSNYWTLFKYWDKFTLLDTATPESRLANWRLERRKFLRTDIATDTEWEIVYDVST